MTFKGLSALTFISGCGPRWTVLAKIFKRQMKSRPPEDGQKWPRYEKVIKSRYEEALLDIFCHLQGTN